jgi:hypothetical protein
MPGSGHKVLEYLARYVFRIAMTNSRIESIDEQTVAFRYRDNRTQLIKRLTISGAEFLERFLQHVLPRGYAKVRYYGIFAPSSRPKLDRVAALLSSPIAPSPVSSSTTPAAPAPPRCPFCNNCNLIAIRVLTPQRSRSP